LAYIEANPDVEICFRDAAWNHVRIAGRAHVSHDDADKATLCEAWPEILNRYAGPDDPKLTIIRMLIDRIEYSHAGVDGWESHEFEAG
jgi:general stress protein 26